jgi:hypothetical protein
MLITSPNLYFTIDGVPSHTPAWRMINTLELAKPAHLRGTKPLVLPGAAGARPMPLRRDATERTINGAVYGLVDVDGNRHPSEIEGLDINLAALAGYWAAVPATVDSTRTCVLHHFGATLTGPVQVLDMDWDYADMPIRANVIFRLLLPEGRLT